MKKENLHDLESRLVSRVDPGVLINFIGNYVAVNGGSIDILELMTKMNIWLEDTLRIARYMVDQGLAKVDGQHISLESSGIDPNFLREYQWLCKWDIQYRTSFETSPEESELIQCFNEVVQNRPSNNNKIDQYYNTPQTNMRRLRLLSREPLSDRKAICFLGDDDLTSLMFAMKGAFSEIVIYDIDPRIIGFINDTATRLGLSRYDAKLYDYRHQPVESAKFDIFHSDPPATIEAVDLVLKRARELAQPSATFYLSWPEFLCDPDYLLGLQKTYAKNGWLVTAKFPEFNEYDNRCFFNYITEADRETLKLFNLTDDIIINSPPMQRYCLTRLLLSENPGTQVGRWDKEIYLSNLHKIPTGRHGGVQSEN